ncbi:MULTISPECIES: NAD-dependent epimerase/dehydratase family protein [unclassified Moraxella]|uniref:NAD-dependent epimerase/dehydratase family protein n=1 Tax=unclassified Moraxella TaxID=2685852 RepID=UPI003AF57015
MKILVTGANGFLGKEVVIFLSSKEEVIACTRHSRYGLDVEHRQLTNFTDAKECNRVLHDIDIVIHCAGLAHVHSTDDVKDDFYKANVQSTKVLAEQALANNVKKFIFISSIGVNGNKTEGQPFTELHTTNPINEYALSKLKAEQALYQIFEKTTTDLIILRPPLIYAGNAPGNFNKLLKIVSLGVPLPFLLLNNKRTMIGLENLLGLIEKCIDYQKPIKATFVIGDDESVSTKQILLNLGKGMDKTVKLLPFPKLLARVGAKIFGQHKLYEQLFCDLEIDNSKIKTTLNWQPEFTTNKLLIKSAQEYKRNLL